MCFYWSRLQYWLSWFMHVPSAQIKKPIQSECFPIFSIHFEAGSYAFLWYNKWNYNHNPHTMTLSYLHSGYRPFCADCLATVQTHQCCLATPKQPWMQMQRSSFARMITIRASQPVKIDLNKRSLPKQKAIQNFIIDAQGFRKTKNENPPTWEMGVTS